MSTELLSGYFCHYTPYKDTLLANQISRKFEVFDRKSKGIHYVFYFYFDFIKDKMKQYC